MTVRFVADGAAMQAYLHGPTGPVVRWLLERAVVLQEAAIHQVGYASGDLQASITKRLGFEGEHPVVWVGVPSGSRAAGYALFHHEGTEPHEIWPKTPGGVLAFRPRGGDDVVFATHVMHPGTRPNKYLTDNLVLAVGESAI